MTADETDYSRLARLLARTVSFDQTLKARAGDSVRIALVANGNPDAKAHCVGLARGFAELQGVKVQGLPLEVVALAPSANLAKDIEAKHISVLYLCPNQDDEAARIAQQSAKARVLTVASSRQQLKRGLILGVFAEADKLALIVNQAEAKRVGIDFADALMNVAKPLE